MQPIVATWSWFQAFLNKWRQVGRRPKRRLFARSRQDIAEIERAGGWYFKRDILDRLESYFDQIGKLRRVDPALYMLYVRTGATVSSGKSGSYVEGQERKDFRVVLNDGWRYGNERPAFGALHWHTDDTEDQITVKFSCFQKMQGKISRVEPTNRTVYRFLALYFDKKTKADLLAVQFYVAIDESGQVDLLKEHRILKQRIRAKDKRKGYSYGFKLSRYEWSWPATLVDLAADHHVAVTAEDLARMLFTFTVNLHRQGNVGVRVTASKGRVKACFNIDMLRTPYFFRDRDVAVEVNGRRKKIFHIVRTHQRQLSGGRSTSVRSHFRGQRDFDWNGYRVHVSMPGFHHADLSDFEAAAEECDAASTPAGSISVQQAAKHLEAHLMK